MSWRVGFPAKWRFLDDEHEELGRLLDQLRKLRKEKAGLNAKILATKILQKLRDHSENEHRLMVEIRYPEYQLHKKVHADIIESIEIVLALFDRAELSKFDRHIAQHLENKLTEEIFFDRLLVQFMANMSPAPRQDGA